MEETLEISTMDCDKTIPENLSTNQLQESSSHVNELNSSGNNNINDNDTINREKTTQSLTKIEDENKSEDNDKEDVLFPSSSKMSPAETLKKEEEQDVDNEVRVDKEIKPVPIGQTCSSKDMVSNGCNNNNRKDSCCSRDSSFSVKRRKSRDYGGDTDIHHHDAENLKKEPLVSHYSTRTMRSSKSILLPTTSEDFTVSNKEDSIRITGYLEKRAKMLGWRKFWCVLDGRLLTYYKSKSDYEGLSACSGSINLGIASTVRPIQIRGCKGYPIQIVTRSQVYYLRSLDKQILEQWLIAIQEASSSKPQISLPVWSDTGSQFFRYSFTALSQWSLNNSNEDITDSLNNLPPNFYLKGALKDPVNKGLNNLYKCHSFASLQSPSMYSTLSMKNALAKLKNNTILKRDKQDLPPQSPQRIEKIRKSTSMLMLNSSAQSSELKKELFRKLSIGTTGENTVKPSLTASKSKCDLPFLITQTIKESGNKDDTSHYYDEIVDFESIYDNREEQFPSIENLNKSRCSLAEKNDNEMDTGIYESVETIDSNDPWVKIEGAETFKKNVINAQRHSIGGSSMENPQEEIPHEKRDSLISQGFPVLPDPPTSSFEELQKKFSIDSSSDTSSYGEASEKLGKKGKKKPFGGFFHKMFHRDKGKKSTNPAPLVITGPVDLRSLHHDTSQSPVNRLTTLPIHEAQAEGTLKRSPAISYKPAFNNTNVMDELKAKVGRMSRTDSESSSSDTNLPCRKPSLKNTRKTPIILKTDSAKENLISRESTKNKIMKDLKNLKIPSTPSLDDKSVSCEERDKFEIEPEVVQRRRPSQSEEFQEKLAKFNRLSEHLSSSFVAALNPVQIYPTVGQIGRSNSWKHIKPYVTKDDKSPPLPPKKKNNPGVHQLNFYDYPTNNKPIEDKLKEDSKNESIKLVAKEPITQFFRGIHKKNSAPEIIFSSSRSSSGDSDSKEGQMVDNVFEEILCYFPPIPPKPKNLSPLPSQPIANPSEIEELQPDQKDQFNYEPGFMESSKEKLILDEIPIKKILEQNNDAIQKTEKNIVKEQICPPSGEKLSSQVHEKKSKCETGSESKDSPPSTQIVLPKSNEILESESSPSKIHFTENQNLTKDSLTEIHNPTVIGDSGPVKDEGLSSMISIPRQDVIKSDLLVSGSENKDQSDPNQSELERKDLYENLRFATVNTLEFETVEETEDEISEMYDDFPTEFLTPVNLSNPGLYEEYEDNAFTSPSDPDLTGFKPSDSSSNSRDSVPHSGIDQLQEFLSMESNESFSSDDLIHSNNQIDDDPTSFPAFPKTAAPFRPGAVSRLGHSSAIEQLQRIVRTRSDV